MEEVKILEETYKNQSCFEFLPTIPSKSVNLILIDPPYEISRTTNFQSGEETGTDTDRFRISMDLVIGIRIFLAQKKFLKKHNGFWLMVAQ